MQLSEAAGISESHLKKIEAGSGRPGIDTYQKIIEILDKDMIAGNERDTVRGNCAARVREILMDSTEEQALFMTGLYPLTGYISLDKMKVYNGTCKLKCVTGWQGMYTMRCWK